MNNCILCALDEVNHFEWRNAAQEHGTHNHQHLSNYRKIVLEKFSQLQPVSSCPVHKNLDPVSITFWESSKKHVNYGEIAKVFFDKIEQIYNLWNQGDVTKATIELNSLFDEMKSSGSDKVEYSNLPLFMFRERTDGETSRDGLWHIPFEDRYKVKNYRFSISGRPMLYLGSSVVDIVYEMRQENCADNTKHMVSTFIRKKDLDIFDLTNEMPLYVHAIWGIVQGGGNIEFDDPRYNLINKFPILIKKLLLMSCCSFKTMHEGATFHEEYIIPQLLTEVLQKKGYDGIRYSSTRMNPNLFNKASDFFWHENYFRENYVLFTKYTDLSKHDSKLKEVFDNSTPVSLSSTSIDENVINRFNILKKEINDFINSNGFISGLPQNILQPSLISYSLRIEGLKYNEEFYYKTKYGTFELNSIIDAYKEYIKSLSITIPQYQSLYNKICAI